MLPILQVGPLTLRTPELALLAALWVGLELASRAGMRRGIDPDHVYNLGFITVLVGLAAARLGFVLANLPLYTNITPWNRAVGAILSLSAGTELPLVGLLAAALTIAVLIRRWELPLLPLADSFAPALGVFVAGIGLALFLGGGYLGRPAAVPWAVPLAGAARHPTQLYLLIVGLLMLAAFYRLRGADLPAGTLMQVILLVLGVGVLLVEPLRADSPTLMWGVRAWSAAALVVVLLVLGGFAARAPAAASEG